jgi:hypothetical protein
MNPIDLPQEWGVVVVLAGSFLSLLALVTWLMKKFANFLAHFLQESLPDLKAVVDTQHETVLLQRSLKDKQGDQSRVLSSLTETLLAVSNSLQQHDSRQQQQFDRYMDKLSSKDMIDQLRHDAVIKAVEKTRVIVSKEDK